MIKTKFYKLIAVMLLLSFANDVAKAEEKIDLAEYLRLEVISKTLHKRAKEQPEWEDLIKPQYTAFRDAMHDFILQSVERMESKALPPPTLYGGEIKWASLEPGKKAIEFDRVPAPWFNLQAELIRNHLDLVDEEFIKSMEEIDQAQMTLWFEVIKDAVLAWPRPPLARPEFD